MPCYARRYLCYAEKGVTVYHYGKHTCSVILKRKKRDSKTVEQLVRNNTKILSPGKYNRYLFFRLFKNRKTGQMFKGKLSLPST